MHWRVFVVGSLLGCATAGPPPCVYGPEDLDGFEDDDGCADPDDDRDGKPDAEDACPRTPEDDDGVADEDGCPESSHYDGDGDGLFDYQDHCRAAKEDRRPPVPRDGCPLEADRPVVIDGEPTSLTFGWYCGRGEHHRSRVVRLTRTGAEVDSTKALAVDPVGYEFEGVPASLQLDNPATAFGDLIDAMPQALFADQREIGLPRTFDECAYFIRVCWQGGCATKRADPQCAEGEVRTYLRKLSDLAPADDDGTKPPFKPYAADLCSPRDPAAGQSVLHGASRPLSGATSPPASPTW